MGEIICVRGAGDIATGIIQKLHRSGFKVLALELENPICIRRTVSLSNAIYEGEMQVEDIIARRITSFNDAFEAWAKGRVPIIVDPDVKAIKALDVTGIIDAIIAKRNLGSFKNKVPISIALGPGYFAGIDCDIVIETNRGHKLGSLIFHGESDKNTRNPGKIMGFSKERVYFAPNTGVVRIIKDIGSKVERGDIIAYVDDVPVKSKMSGLIRGMYRDGIIINDGFKLADIDPRKEELNLCYTISDKARAIGGAALEAILIGIRNKENL